MMKKKNNSKNDLFYQGTLVSIQKKNASIGRPIAVYGNYNGVEGLDNGGRARPFLNWWPSGRNMAKQLHEQMMNHL
jgi:hypothetical protein